MKVFLKEYYNLLVVAHLLATFVLIGAMTHNLLIVLKYVGGKFGRKKLDYFYVKVSLWAYVVVYALGALAYPAFRINTRAALFDKTLPWATGLFEVKEHWGALGLAFFVVYYLLRQVVQDHDAALLSSGACLAVGQAGWAFSGVVQYSDVCFSLRGGGYAGGICGSEIHRLQDGRIGASGRQTARHRRDYPDRGVHGLHRIF